ncbi:MAG: hypothetical protein ACU84H_04485 [Gammaproteobacteria bacterium]
MNKLVFSSWLKDALLFIGRGPFVWFGYAFFVGILLLAGRISFVLGLFFAVTSLFVGVGIAKYIDLRAEGESPVALGWAVRKSLPLAVLAAAVIIIFWFIFNVLANVLSGEIENIPLFFFDWQLTPENMKRRTVREIAAWFYTYANVTLIFVLLMLTTFASWFSYPLMLFRNRSFSQAKELGERQVSQNKVAFYKMLAFIVAEALLCSSVTPLLTPVLYMLVSTLMYVSYQNQFSNKRD